MPGVEMKSSDWFGEDAQALSGHESALGCLAKPHEDATTFRYYSTPRQYEPRGVQE
jgi:hypothetical protein